jgi:general secretion pathway protein E
MCHDTGYRGRLAVFEALRLDSRLRRLVAEGTDAAELEAVARDAGQGSLREDALAKLRAGRTTCAEVVRVIA